MNKGKYYIYDWSVYTNGKIQHDKSVYFKIHTRYETLFIKGA